MTKKLIILLIFFVDIGYSQIFTENFETDITAPTDARKKWKSTSPNGATWELNDGTDHGPNSAYSGSKAIMFNVYDYSNGKSGIIESPSFDLSTTQNPVLKFFWWCTDDNDRKISRLAIKTSTDGTTFTELTSFNAYKSGGWKEFSHPINKQVVKIQIVGVSAYGNKNIFIDELTIGDPADYKFNANSTNYSSQANTGEQISFSISIENKGAKNDSYSFTKASVKSWDWKAYTTDGTEITNIAVNAGQSKTFVIKALVPNSGLTHGEEESFNFTLTSNGENTKTVDLNYKVLAIVPLNNSEKAYTFNFDELKTSDLPIGWTMENADNNSNQWEINTSAKALYFNHRYNSANDWIYSQPIVLAPNTAYRLRYKVKGTSRWSPFKLDAYVGNNKEAIKTSSALESLSLKTETYSSREVYFTSANANPTYIAFHIKEKSVYIDNITIDKAPAYEPKLVSTISSQNIIAGEQLEIPITVSNNGGNADKLNLSSTYNYPVSFKNSENNTITSLDLNSQESASIKAVLTIPANGLVNREKLDLIIKATSENQISKIAQIKIKTTSYVNYRFPFLENFEANTNKWVFTENSVLQKDEFSGSKYAHIKSKTSEDYDLVLNSFIDLTGTIAPVLEFDHNANIGSYDKFSVKVREFGADYFTKLETVVYTGTPVYGRYGFDKNSLSEWTFSDNNQNFKSENWKHAMFDLSAYKGKRIEIQFIAEYGSYVGKGWLLDNIAVKEAPQYTFVASKKSKEQKAYVQEWANHSIEITNKGSKSDTYTFAVENTAWPVKYYNTDNSEITEILLAPNAKKTILIKTQVANDITMGQIETAKIKITSKGENSKFEKVSIQTKALQSFNIPYQENFDDGNSINLEAWQTINANNDSKEWKRQSYYSQSRSYAYNVNNSYTSKPMNDWLITPKFKLENGKRYQVKFFVRGIGTAIEKLALTYAKNNTLADFESNIVLTKEDINSTTYTKCVAKITASETADFYLAFKGYSNARTKGLVIDDFSIEEFLNNDLKINALSVVNSGFIIENSTVNIKANIENIGANSVTDKKISLLSNNVEIASTTLSLSSGETKDVNLSFQAKLGANQTIICKISDDDNNTNNTKGLSFSAYKKGYLLEGFEGETFPPKDWTLEKIDNLGNNYIAYQSDGYNSKNNARLKANYSKLSKARLITPELSIKAGDKIEFYTKQNSENTLVLEYTTDGTTYTNLAAIPLTNTYKKESIDLSSLAGQKVKIAFKATTKGYYSAFVGIDNVSGPQLAGALKPKMTLNKSLGGIAHEFNPFNLGATPEKFELTINNVGNAVLELTAEHIKLTGANSNEYEMNASFPLNISPGASFNLQIKPKAATIGTKKVQIEIKDPQDQSNVKIKQFSVKVNPPKVGITSPLNSATGISLKPLVEWENITGAYKIDFYVSESTIFTEKDKKLNNVDFTNSYQFTENLKYGQRYFIKLVVKATKENIEYSSESKIYNFTAELGDNILQIGEVKKEETGLNALPMSCETNYTTYSQSIYNKNLFDTKGKRIKQVFYYYNGKHQFEQDIVLYMANTDKVDLSGSGYTYVPFNQLEEVYRGKFNLPKVEGWVAIDLPVAFDYDTQKNLVIAFDANARLIGNSEAGFYMMDDQNIVTKFNRHHSEFGNPDPKDPDLGGLTTRQKPILRFGLEDAPTKPIIYTTTKSIKFDQCAVFQSPEKEMEIRNIGLGELDVTNIEIIGANADNFRLETASKFKIQQGARAKIKVKFTPKSEGLKKAELKISSARNSTITVKLDAEAIDTKISTFPFLEDFEGAVFPIAGWQTDKYWMLASSGFQSNHSATCEFNRVDDAIMVTPPIILEDNLQLTFRWKNKYTPTGRLGTEDYTFVEITEDNGINWQELGNYTINYESFDYQLHKIDLSAYAGKTVKIRFRHSITPFGNRKTQAITLDDITIEEIPYTPATTISSLAIEGDNGIKIEWSAPTLDPTKPSNPIKGYILYRNGKRIQKDLITATSFIDENLKRGEYEYVIAVQYEKGQSALSMPDILMLDIEEAFPVNNLDAEILNNGDRKNVKLTWDKPVKKRTIKLLPTDDTYGPAKTGKYDQGQIWVANYAPKGHHEVGMFKFDVKGLDATKIDKVTLRLNQIFMANDYNTEPSKVYALSENWTETGFDYSSKPKYDKSKAWAEYYFGSNGWQEIDITDLVKAWIKGTVKNNGLCLVAAEGDRLRVFDSKEAFTASNRPHINILTEDNSNNPNHGHGTGYKVYRNDVEIAQIDNFNTTEYTDVNLKPDFYAYTVSAMYSKAGESEKSTPKIVNVSLSDESAWTWMIYLYEDNTGLDGAEDINELEVLGSIPGMVNYIVLYDANDDSKDGIYYVEKDSEGENNTIISRKISDQFGVDPKMSDWNLLSKFMKWSAEQFPAQNYALTMWDHGNGIFRSSEETVRSFVGNMNLWEMDRALKQFTDFTKKKLEIVGFDLCLLGQAETVYQMKDFTNYVIASEKTEPGDGWDYITQFTPLNKNPLIKPSVLCKHMVEEYVKSYSIGGNSNIAPVTQAATDTKVFEEEMIPALNSFAGKLIDNLYSHKAEIERLRDLAWNSSRNIDHKDLGHFAKLIGNSKSLPSDLKQSANDFLVKYKKAIVATGSTEKANEETTGLRIWIPKAVSAETANAELYLDPVNYLKISETLWDEFIFNYENPKQNPKRLTTESNKISIDATATSAEIRVTKTGDGDVYWDIDHQGKWFTISNTQLKNTNTLTLAMKPNTGAERKGVVNITAKGVIGCPMKIEIAQTSAFKPATNISATSASKQVTITWEKPASTITPTEIVLYRDDKKIANITDMTSTSYLDANVEEGEHNYHVVIKYGEFSSKNSATVNVNVKEKIAVSFKATLKPKNIVKLEWEVIESSSNITEYIVCVNGKKHKSITDVNQTSYLYNLNASGEFVFHVEFKFENTKLISSAKKTIQVETITPVKNVELEEIKVYPNPVVNNLKVSIGNTQAESIQLYSIVGNLLYNNLQVNQSIIEVPMEHLPNGTYVLRIQTKSGYKVYKITK